MFDHNGVIYEWNTTSLLKKNNFTDAFREVYPDEVLNPGITWPSFATGVGSTSWTPKSDERDRIDYIFYKGVDVKVKDAAIVGPRKSFIKNVLSNANTENDHFLAETLPWPSDHKGVFATISIPKTSDFINSFEETTGSYIKTAASVYPENTFIIVNYKDENYSDKDWIGIYKKEDIPGGGHESLEWHYALKDSSTVNFNALPIGDYVAYLCCCDGYTVKAKYNFKVVGSNTASLVLNSISFEVGDPLEFTYNDPNFVSGNGTDWIGIYHEGDIPSDVRSIIWDYLKDTNGTMTFSVPYPNGTLLETDPTMALEPGEYYAGLFCCDAYGLYAQTSFTIIDPKSGLQDKFISNHLSIYPNPSDGMIKIKINDRAKLHKISVYTLSGKVVFQERLNSSVSQKTLDLKYLPKGIYFIEALTDQYKASNRLIIK